MSSFIGNFIQILMVALGTLLAIVGITWALSYLQAHNIKSNVENYALDIMAYGTKHNGFNDPHNGGYTFDEMNEKLIKRHNLEGYILNVDLKPGKGQIAGRRKQIGISVTYQYPTVTPLDPRDTMAPPGEINLTDTVHGYVKRPRVNKPFDENKNWWEWEDEFD